MARKRTVKKELKPLKLKRFLVKPDDEKSFVIEAQDLNQVYSIINNNKQNE